MPVAVEIPEDRLGEFCRRYRVRELSLFGSSLREDFGPDSDVDVLVEFDPSARVGFMTLSKMQRELSALLRRRVDLVPKPGLKEKIRQSVLDGARVIAYFVVDWSIVWETATQDAPQLRRQVLEILANEFG